MQRIHARPIPKGDSHSSIVCAARVVPWQNYEACFEVLLTVMQVCGLLLVSQSCLTLCDPTDWTVARQASLSIEFSRQEYWSGLPFPSPENFPTQGSNPGFLPRRQILYYLSFHLCRLCGSQFPEGHCLQRTCIVHTYSFPADGSKGS